MIRNVTKLFSGLPFALRCQEQTAIARTFNDERFEEPLRHRGLRLGQEWEERRAHAKESGFCGF